MMIPLSQIRLPEKDLRAYIDADALDELTDSFRDVGQLQAIGVRLVGPEQYEVVFGARRYRAAQILKWPEIRCEISDRPDEENTAAHKLIENVQRQNLSPIEEAYGLLDLVGDDGPNFRELQRQTGKSREWIKSRLELVTMPDDVQHVLQSGAISIGVAKAFATIEDEHLRADYLRHASENQITADDAMRYASHAAAAATGIATMLEHDAEQEATREKMPYAPSLWLCVNCRQQHEQRNCVQIVLCRGCMLATTAARSPLEHRGE